MSSTETLKALNGYISKNYSRTWQKAYRMTNYRYNGQYEARARAILANVIDLEPAAFAAACTNVLGIS